MTYGLGKEGSRYDFLRRKSDLEEVKLVVSVLFLFCLNSQQRGYKEMKDAWLIVFGDLVGHSFFELIFSMIYWMECEMRENIR